MSSNNFQTTSAHYFVKGRLKPFFGFRRPFNYLAYPYSATVLRISFSALASVFSTSAN